jgi:hypothetical protein
VAAIVAAVLAAGAVNGVGPLAHETPPDQVTDPREMLARSVQTVIDASSVHVVVSISGRVPGALVGRPDASVALDGTQAVLDLRPQDARSHLVFASRPLGLDLESLTLWDSLAYRSAGGGWTRGSLGSVTAASGIDANPLTLVDRLRAWLAAPGSPVPTSTDVPCDAPSGLCREVRLTLDSGPGEALLALLPARGGTVGATTTEIVLESDAATLRPAHLVVLTRNAGGSLQVVLTVDTSYWDWPSVIPDPPG